MHCFWESRTLAIPNFTDEKGEGRSSKITESKVFHLLDSPWLHYKFNSKFCFSYTTEVHWTFAFVYKQALQNLEHPSDAVQVLLRVPVQA